MNRKEILLLVLFLALVFTSLFIIKSYKYKDLGDVEALSNKYEADKEIEEALKKLNFRTTKAGLIRKASTNEKVISLVFQGLSDEQTVGRVVSLADQYKTTIPFAVSGNVAAEGSEIIKKISDQGFSFVNNTLIEDRELKKFSSKDLVRDFVRSNKIIESTSGQRASLLLGKKSDYSDAYLKAAFASENKKVIEPSAFLNYQSFKSYEELYNYFSSLDRGSLLVFKMDGILSADQFVSQKADGKEDVTKEHGKDQQKKDEESPEERTVKIIQWLFHALDELGYKIVAPDKLADYHGYFVMEEGRPLGGLASINPVSEKIKKSELDRLRKENKGALAKEHRTVYTTEKALSYTFYGIGDELMLKKILNNMDSLGAKGSFFVGQRDLLNNSAAVIEIARRGHEIGMAIHESTEYDFYSTLESILSMQKEIARLTGQKANLVRYPYDLKIKDEVLEAISAASSSVLWQNLALASSTVGPNGNINQVMANIFGEGNIVAHRGYIIYFRMDYYKDPDLIANSILRIYKDRIELVAFDDGIKNNGSQYKIKPAGQLLTGNRVYTYPVPEGKFLTELKDAVSFGKLAGMNQTDIMRLINARYIGNPDINKTNVLPGFTPNELARVDSSGRFTNDKVLFLTFDDWSSDKPINQLLYVLQKHNVKASFFIRTNYMQNNPNILRAIALDGHDIGSHTDEHIPFAVRRDGLDEDDTFSDYYQPSIRYLENAKDDLLLSFTKLLSVAGDVAINGRPAVNTYFRPPTLAMSRSGMEAIFDMGFSYIISGDFSSQDYADNDYEELVDRVLNGMEMSDGNLREIQNGSIIVMHMSDFKENPFFAPNVTAQALDELIPELKKRGYSFARLSDYLYLKEGAGYAGK